MIDFDELDAKSLRVWWWVNLIAIPFYLLVIWLVLEPVQGGDSFQEWFLRLTLDFVRDGLGLAAAGLIFTTVLLITVLQNFYFAGFRSQDRTEREDLLRITYIKLIFWQALPVYGIAYYLFAELRSVDAPQTLAILGAITGIAGLVWLRYEDAPEAFQQVDS